MITGSTSKVPIDYDVRYYEAETAEDNGIPFDWRWYSIDVMAREQMIASRLARTSVGNLMQRHANRKAH